MKIWEKQTSIYCERESNAWGCFSSQCDGVQVFLLNVFLTLVPFMPPPSWTIMSLYNCLGFVVCCKFYPFAIFLNPVASTVYTSCLDRLFKPFLIRLQYILWVTHFPSFLYYVIINNCLFLWFQLSFLFAVANIFVACSLFFSNKENF